MVLFDMRIGLIAMSGVRIKSPELTALGVTLLASHSHAQFSQTEEHATKFMSASQYAEEHAADRRRDTTIRCCDASR